MTELAQEPRNISPEYFYTPDHLKMERCGPAILGCNSEYIILQNTIVSVGYSL